VRLTYPAADPATDLTSRPDAAAGGTVRFLVAGRERVVRHVRGTTFSVRVPAGATVRIPAGAATDSSGNVSARDVTFRAG
jgi:hypothetical protein